MKRFLHVETGAHRIRCELEKGLNRSMCCYKFASRWSKKSTLTPVNWDPDNHDPWTRSVERLQWEIKFSWQFARTLYSWVQHLAKEFGSGNGEGISVSSLTRAFWFRLAGCWQRVLKSQSSPGNFGCHCPDFLPFFGIKYASCLDILFRSIGHPARSPSRSGRVISSVSSLTRPVFHIYRQE